MIRPTHILAATALLAVGLPAQIKQCTSVNIGSKCGAELKVEDRIRIGPPLLHAFKIEVKDGPADTFGFLAIGLSQTNYVFPGSMCNVYVDNLIKPFLFHTDRKGKWKVSFTENQKLNVTAHLQAVVADGSAVVTTNGVSITCSDG